MTKLCQHFRTKKLSLIFCLTTWLCYTTHTHTHTHYGMVSLTLSHTHFLILSLTLPLFLTAAKKSWEKISTSGSLTVLFCLDIINKGTIKAKFWTKFLSIMVAQHELLLFCSKKSPVLKTDGTSRSTP